MKEVFRWRPVSSGGFAHAAIAEDVYGEKYRIPKGALVIPNHYSIHHDSAVRDLVFLLRGPNCTADFAYLPGL